MLWQYSVGVFVRARNGGPEKKRAREKESWSERNVHLGIALS